MEWRLPAFCKNAKVNVLINSCDSDDAEPFSVSEKVLVPAWSVTVLEIKKPE